jgi:hypothetical protein
MLEVAPGLEVKLRGCLKLVEQLKTGKVFKFHVWNVQFSYIVLKMRNSFCALTADALARSAWLDKSKLMRMVLV